MYLIQRLNALHGEPKPEKGFDGFFNLDYMGSAEFEFGAVNRSLKRIRAQGEVSSHVVQIRMNSTMYPVFVVTSGDSEEDAFRLQVWLDDGYRTKEPTYFPERLIGQDGCDEWKLRTVAWWNLGAENEYGPIEDFGWALDENVADLLVLAFNGKKSG